MTIAQVKAKRRLALQSPKSKRAEANALKGIRTGKAKK